MLSGQQSTRPRDEQPILVGREREQAQLRQLLADTIIGRGSLVLISGEAGIGKTTLVNDLAREAEQRGCLVLSGGCYDLTTTPPYGPWIEIVRAYPEAGDLPPLPAQLQTDGGMAGIDSQVALFDLIGRFLHSVACHCPIALFVEDIHWADPGSLNLLRYFARTLSNDPVLLIATYRTDEIAPDHDLFALLPTLIREARAHRLKLDPLDRRNILTLIRERYRLATTDEERLLEYLQQLAEGNPFFTTELLYTLEEQHLLSSGPHSWQLGDLTAFRVPSLIHQVISRRLTPLQSTTRILLDLAAVVGYEAPLELLQGLHQGSDAALDDGLQQALDRGLLALRSNQRSVRFTHALVRQSVYEAIPPLRCQNLHRQVGELLVERSGSDPSRVANHFFQAGDPRAVPWLIRAAERAASLFAPEAVITRCDQAIDLTLRLGDEPSPHPHRLRGLARETVGDIDGAREDHEAALDLARKQSDQRAEWQALLDLGALWASRDYGTSKDYIEQALDLAHRIGDAALLGESLNRLGNWYASAEDSEAALQHHQKALEVFERLDHRPGIAATLDLLGMTYAMAGNVPRSVEAFKRAIPLLRMLDARQALVSALITHAAIHFGSEHWIHASSMEHRKPATPIERTKGMDEAIRIARDFGWRAGEAFGLGLSAQAAGIFGEYDRAIRHGKEAIQISSAIQHRQWLALSSCSLGMIYLDLFATDQALEHLQRAHDLAISRFWTGIATSLLVAAHIAHRDDKLAEVHLESLIGEIGLSTALGKRNSWFALAELQLAQGDLESAQSTMDQLETLIPGTPEQRAPHTRELHGRIFIAGKQYSEAEIELRGAQQTAETFGYQPILWRIHASLQTLYLEQGRLEEAEEARQAALRIIDELANKLDDNELCSTFVTSARTKLPGGLPFGADRPSTTSFAGLTQRETEVLRLVAQGMTNVAVGEVLFISPRTISQHLGSIYAKLEVSNRTEATRIAIERGLV